MDMAALATRQSLPRSHSQKGNGGDFCIPPKWNLPRMSGNFSQCGPQDTDAMRSRQLVTIVKKKEKVSCRCGFRPIAVLQAIVRFNSEILQSQAGPALKSRRCPQYGHFPGRQAHEVVFVLRRLVKQATEWQIPIFVTDCDVAAASDHVSHHVIPNAMEAMNVPPLLLAAWLRECRGSDTFIKLDDIMTPWIRRTRSAPQGDLCAVWCSIGNPCGNSLRDVSVRGAVVVTASVEDINSSIVSLQACLTGLTLFRRRAPRLFFGAAFRARAKEEFRMYMS